MKTRRTILISSKPVHFDLDLSQFSQKNIYDMTADGLYEIETVRMMERLLKPGDTFIDVGAHVGYFSMIAAALVGESGYVHAFEPERHNAEAFHDNLKLNWTNQLRLFRNAVSFEEGMRALWVNADNDGGHAFWDVRSHPFNKKTNGEKVPAVTLSLDYLWKSEMPIAKLIKIDVEGSELDVLRGAQELLKANPDCSVICEINRFALAQMGTSEQELRTFMHERGYHCWYLPPNEDNPQELPFGETTSMEGFVFNVLFKKGEL